MLDLPQIHHKFYNSPYFNHIEFRREHDGNFGIGMVHVGQYLYYGLLCISILFLF